MTDLVERLRAALDETERVARAVPAFCWDEDVAAPGGWNEYHEEVRAHIALHDPERELRMVAAHRTILDEHDRICTQYNDPKRTEPMAMGPAYGLWLAIVALAEAYGVEA